jgi:hypothetical protein
MPIRETERIVTVSGRRWKIKKFDALTGSYIALKMMSKISHIAVGVFAGNLTDKAVIAMSIANEIGTLTKQEFNEIQSECLHVATELVTVGDKVVDTPIRLPDGRWGVSGVEDDALLVMTLVSHSLLFNLTSFFDGNALKDSKESFKGLIPFDAQTSTNTPTPL